jgi:hypothetical protein
MKFGKIATGAGSPVFPDVLPLVEGGGYKEARIPSISREKMVFRHSLGD